jgi:hypothetical protein
MMRTQASPFESKALEMHLKVHQNSEERTKTNQTGNILLVEP